MRRSTNHAALEQLGPIVIPRLAHAIEEVTGIDPDEVTYQISFTDDLGIDSFSMIEVAVHIECEYGVKVPDEHLAHLHSVDDVIDYAFSTIREFPRAACELAKQFGSPDEQAVVYRIAYTP